MRTFLLLLAGAVVVSHAAAASLDLDGLDTAVRVKCSDKNDKRFLACGCYLSFKSLIGSSRGRSTDLAWCQSNFGPPSKQKKSCSTFKKGKKLCTKKFVKKMNKYLRKCLPQFGGSALDIGSGCVKI